MHWHASHVQTIQDIFNSLKGFYEFYLVLKFGNIFPINKWYMAQNVISQRSVFRYGIPIIDQKVARKRKKERR